MFGTTPGKEEDEDGLVWNQIENFKSQTSDLTDQLSKTSEFKSGGGRRETNEIKQR